MNPGMYSSAHGDWETPQELYDELNKEFDFTLDACATAETAKAKAWFTVSDNALTLDWTGRVYMNPPYGREISAWIEKAYREAQTHADVVVCLVPSRTDTRWWHDYCMQGEIRFIKGRLHFKRAGDTGPAPFPSAIVVFRPTTQEGDIDEHQRELDSHIP